MTTLVRLERSICRYGPLKSPIPARAPGGQGVHRAPQAEQPRTHSPSAAWRPIPLGGNEAVYSRDGDRTADTRNNVSDQSCISCYDGPGFGREDISRKGGSLRIPNSSYNQIGVRRKPFVGIASSITAGRSQDVARHRATVVLPPAMLLGK